MDIQKKWDQYVEFTRTTAIYPKDRAITYLMLGLISEVGEVAGKVKKRIRDGELSVPTSAIVSEIGDCLWYLARLEDEWPEAVAPLSIEGASERAPVYHANIHHALACAATYAGVYDIAYDIDAVLSALIYVLNEIGSSIDAALEDNIEKLTSRKARNVLSGSGDNR